MSPKRNKKNRKKDNDLDQIDEKASKWALILQEKPQQPNAQQLYGRPNKKSFNYDFSNEKQIYKELKKQKEQKIKPIIDPKLQKILNERAQVELSQKLKKQQTKEQKKKEKKKLNEVRKQKDKQQKQLQQKQEQELEKQKKKGKNSDKWIPLILLFLLIVMGVLKYQSQIYARLQKFKLGEKIDYYEVLQIDNGATDSQLKQQYKRLVLKYHPDKNLNCEFCKQKFDAIMSAWEVLGNPQKKKHYDQETGFINEIKSISLTLTPNNYQNMVTDSDWLWIVQVYDSTDQYCHHFAQAWESIVNDYKDLIKFGRVDIWRQGDMRSYLPYKFQIFPSIYYSNKGKVDLCEIDYNFPIPSINKCIEMQYSSSFIHKIKQQVEIINDNRINLIFGGKIKITPRLLMVCQRFIKDIKYYQISNSQNIIYTHAFKNKTYVLKDKSKNKFKMFSKFLQSMISREVDLCNFQRQCSNQKCIILLNKLIQIPEQNTYSIYHINANDEALFTQTLQQMKNRTMNYDKFEIGLYEDGMIDLGYRNDINELNPALGELLNLKCEQKKTWWKYITSFL